MIRPIKIAAIVLPVLIGSAVQALAQPYAPENAFQIRFGGFFPSGGGEVWDDNEEVFTLRVSDFDGFIWGFSYVRGLNNKIEVGFNLDFYSQTVRSSYRGFVDEDGFPILHDTRLEETPLTADVRYLPWGRYRIRGPVARRVLKPVFYIGAGAGVNFWEYSEQGDFLDFVEDPPEIFFASFRDSGTAFEVHGLTGVEFPLSPGFTLFFEGRYAWSEVNLGGDFAGLGKLNLGGGSAYVGGSFRF